MKNKGIAAPGFMNLSKFLAVGVLLLIVGVLIYSNTWHAESQFDDDFHIKSNISLRGNFDIPKIWAASVKTRFLAYVTFAFNVQMGGDNPVGFHLFNVGIHVLNAFWTYLLIVLLLRAPKMNGIYTPKTSQALAVFTALLFLVHPLQTQAVTYVVQRMASLAAFFYLGAIVFYLKYRIDFRKGYFLVSLGMSLAAMFCKENAITLPLAIIMVDLLFFEQKGGIGKGLLRWMPFWLTVLPALYLNGILQGVFRSIGLLKGNFVVSDILPTEGFLSRGKYLLTQFSVLCTYLRLLIFPVNQNLDYDYPIAKSFFEVRTMASFFSLATLLVAAVLWIKKNRFLSFGIFWFFLTLSVESSIIPIKDVIYEHRMYLPMAGCALFLCLGLYELLKDWKQWVVVMVLAVCVFSSLTYARNQVWRTRVRMWEDVVKKSSEKARGYNNLGDSYSRVGREAQAAKCFQKAIELDPDYAEAYYNLGNTWGVLGDRQKEKEYYQKAIEKNPKYWSPYINLGVLLGQEGDLEGALGKFQTVLQGAPEYVIAYDNVGVTYSRMGDSEKAIQNFQKAIQLNPYYPPAHYHLGHLLSNLGDFRAAASELKRAVQEDPLYADAWFELGKAYLSLGDLQGVAWVGERLLAISQTELAKQLVALAGEGVSPAPATASGKETSGSKGTRLGNGTFLRKISKECMEGDPDCEKEGEMSEKEKKQVQLVRTTQLARLISEQQRAISVTKSILSTQVFSTRIPVSPQRVSNLAFQRAVSSAEILEN